MELSKYVECRDDVQYAGAVVLLHALHGAGTADEHGAAPGFEHGDGRADERRYCVCVAGRDREDYSAEVVMILERSVGLNKMKNKPVSGGLEAMSGVSA